MPTATKLISALFFAAITWLAADAYVPGLPEGTQIGYFREISALVGAVVAWKWLATRVGFGYGISVSQGFMTSALILLWVNLGFSCQEMIERAYDRRYRDPFEAVVSIFDIMMQYGALLVRPETPLILAIGGMIGGALAEFIKRRWT